jgi:hypothetical protein
MPRHRITPAARQAGCEAVQARANKRAAHRAAGRHAAGQDRPDTAPAPRTRGVSFPHASFKADYPTGAAESFEQKTFLSNEIPFLTLK